MFYVFLFLFIASSSFAAPIHVLCSVSLLGSPVIPCKMEKRRKQTTFNRHTHTHWNGLERTNKQFNVVLLRFVNVSTRGSHINTFLDCGLYVARQRQHVHAPIICHVRRTQAKCECVSFHFVFSFLASATYLSLELSPVHFEERLLYRCHDDRVCAQGNANSIEMQTEKCTLFLFAAVGSWFRCTEHRT